MKALRSSSDELSSNLFTAIASSKYQKNYYVSAVFLIFNTCDTRLNLTSLAPECCKELPDLGRKAIVTSATLKDSLEVKDIILAGEAVIGQAEPITTDTGGRKRDMFW